MSKFSEPALLRETPMLREACSYATRGWAVFPVHGIAPNGFCTCKNPGCESPGKHPRTPHGVLDASKDEATIREWFDRWPDSNLAVATGSASGIVVLDVDPPNGESSLAKLLREHGPLPATLESQTGRGRQIFFSLSDSQTIRNSAGVLGEGLDVRGVRGYVVLPPSRHKNGCTYLWRSGSPTSLPPAPLPAWLAALLVKKPHSAPSAQNAAPPKIHKGQRNATLTSLAGTMSRRGMTRSAIEAALLTENTNRCEPPLSDVEVKSIAKSVSRYTPDGETLPTEQGPQDEERTTSPEFPKAAWRGLFAEYRSAMERATEANDAYHFASLWARCAVGLGRRVYFPYGMGLYPNVYLVCFGPTGDRKTTATRKGTELGSSFKIIQGSGSGEGLADEFSGAEPGQGFLLYAEEFSQVLRPGRWDGATLLPFLTQCFDCPLRYEMKYRKSPVALEQPTPSLLAGATPVWFWQDFRVNDFHGGYGNRLFFFTGARKPAMPLPESPNLDTISCVVDTLTAIQQREARLDEKARSLWEEFYRAWAAEQSRRDPLLLASVQRIPSYILKLAMLYAALERTLPEIKSDQLAAAILVGRYGEDCAKELLSLQNAGTNPRKELERRILALVGTEPSGMTTKRAIYKRLWRHYKDTEEFNRAFDSLVRAGEVFTKTAERGSVRVSKEPLE